MMKIIVITILFILLLCLKSFSYHQMSKKKLIKKNNVSNTVYYSSSLKIIMIFIILCWLIILALVLLFIKEDKYAKIFICGFIILLCLFCFIYLVYICNWKITLKERSFIYKKIEYNYEYLQVCFYSNKIKIFKNGKKIVSISHYTENSLLLSDKIIKENKNNNYLIVIPSNKKEYYFIQ